MTVPYADEPYRISPKESTSIIRRYRTEFMVFGAVMTALGAFAIAYPLYTTIFAKSFVGWLLLISGVVQVVYAFLTPRWSEFFLNIAMSVIYIIAGIWLAFYPLAGIVTLTALLAGVFIVQGLLQLAMALRTHASSGWLWMFLAGVIAIGVGILIFLGLPDSGAWAIGLMVGINLVATGLSYLFLAIAPGH